LISALDKHRDILTPMKYRFALAMLLCTFGAASDDKGSPLPEKIVTAKTVFIQNETGEIKFSDNVRKQLEDWGRWQIVKSKAEADLVLSLQHQQRFHNNFLLVILDRQSGETLWTVKKDVAIGGYAGVARILMADLRKRLPPI
jgi:hypothetical protein